MKKSQIALEYIIILSIVMIIFSIILYMVGDYKIGKGEEQTQQIAKEMIYSIQNEVILAQAVHDGYQRTFYLPYDVAGDKNYYINNTNNSIILQVKNYQITTTVPTINGTIKKGNNNITKINNQITLNQ